MLFPSLWARFCSSYVVILMKHLYKCWQLVLFLCKCFTVCLYSVLSDNGSWLLLSFLLSLLYLYLFIFSHFFFMFHPFLAFWRFLSPSPFLSKSLPTDANSLNMFPRDHLWTANGCLACLFFVSYKYFFPFLSLPSSSFSVLAFFTFPFTLSPSLFS